MLTAKTLNRRIEDGYKNSAVSKNVQQKKRGRVQKTVLTAKTLCRRREDVDV